MSVIAVREANPAKWAREEKLGHADNEDLKENADGTVTSLNGADPGQQASIIIPTM
jgi:hypothetical protein